MYVHSTSVLPKTGARRLMTVVPETTPTVSRSGVPVFGNTHPLAKVAKARCAEHRGSKKFLPGAVACARCWEAVIRADERIVVEFELDGAEPVPADDVDEIAVELAVAGKRVNDGPVPLTLAERVEVVSRLARQGLDVEAISYRLGTGPGAVAKALSLIDKAAVSCPRCESRVELSARGGEQRLMCGSCGTSFLSGDAVAWKAAA